MRFGRTIPTGLLALLLLGGAAAAESDLQTMIDAAREKHDAVADVADRLAGMEEIDRERLQDGTFEIGAHAARAMAAGQQQPIEIRRARIAPSDRRTPFGARDHRIVGCAASGIGAQKTADQHEAVEAGAKAPRIEPAPMQHEIVCLGRRAVGRRENDRMSEIAQHAPGDRRFGRVIVAGGKRNQDARHAALVAGARSIERPLASGKEKEERHGGRRSSAHPRVPTANRRLLCVVPARNNASALE